MCFAYGPLVVLVTDSAVFHNPNVTVNWAITSGRLRGSAYGGCCDHHLIRWDGEPIPWLTSVSATGSPFQQYVTSTVTASTSNAAVPFSLPRRCTTP